MTYRHNSNYVEFHFKKTWLGIKLMIIEKVPTDSPGQFKEIEKAADYQTSVNIFNSITEAFEAKKELQKLKIERPELFI